MNAYVTETDPDGEAEDVVAACPHCDSASLSTRNSSGVRGRRTTAEYYCQDCRSTFDEPVIRARRHSGRCRGLAGKLEDADPGDIGVDGTESVGETTRVDREEDTGPGEESSTTRNR